MFPSHDLGVLEIELSINDGQWADPSASWLMSKVSGQILRIRLSKTPQIAWSSERNNHLDPDWKNASRDNSDGVSAFLVDAPKGSLAVTVNLSAFGKILRPGHVIGHAFDCYMVDEIAYAGSVASFTVSPPIRRDILAGDDCLITPWFTGRISNGADMRSQYNHLGHIKMGNIILHEAII